MRGYLEVHPTLGYRAWHCAALSKPVLLREGRAAPAPPHPAALCLGRRFWQKLLSQIVQNLAFTQSRLLTVFSLCEQKVSVSYLKGIYNIPFDQLGVTRLSVNGTVCYRIKDNAKAF